MRYFVVFGLIFSYSCNVVAQGVTNNTFFNKMYGFGEYARGHTILEDQMGGLIAIDVYKGVKRYSSKGKLLWTNGSSGADGELISVPNSDKIYVFHFGFGLGLSTNIFNLKGEYLGVKDIDPFIDSTIKISRQIRSVYWNEQKKHFVVAGLQHKYPGFANRKTWLAHLDTFGNILWETGVKFPIVESDDFPTYGKIMPNKKFNGYTAITGVKKMHHQPYDSLMVLDSLGKPIMGARIITPNPCNTSRLGQVQYLDATVTDDTSFVILYTQNYLDNECIFTLSGFFVDHYNTDLQLIRRVRLFDNLLHPDHLATYEPHSIRKNKHGGYVIGNPIGFIVLDSKLDTVFTRNIFATYNPAPYPDLPYTAEGDRYISKGDDDEVQVEMPYWSPVLATEDGGYYGMATSRRFAPYYSKEIGMDWYYNIGVEVLFKTDSAGLIYPQSTQPEKYEALMLLPNPAKDNLRVAIPNYWKNVSAIPNYWGNVSIEIYDMQGKIVLTTTQNQKDYLDIGFLKNGVYIVKGKIVETQQSNTMKLVVQK